jgi:hypothetical protein
MLGGFYFLLTEILTTYLIQINCKSFMFKYENYFQNMQEYFRRVQEAHFAHERGLFRIRRGRAATDLEWFEGCHFLGEMTPLKRFVCSTNRYLVFIKFSFPEKRVQKPYK